MTQPSPIIELKNISKDFALTGERPRTLRERFLQAFHFIPRHHLKVFQSISLLIRQGESVGIIGENGSGKSTLLKIIGGILSPRQGSVVVSGSVSPFLELGVGFQPELSGRENVFLHGALLGMNRQEIESKYKQIVDFAGTEALMNQPLKHYSSGMQMRLGFAVAAHVEADIYLVDEALAVGDLVFQKKCLDFFQDLKRRNKTIVFVGHDLQALSLFCDRSILLHHGKILADGKTFEVINRYRQIIQLGNSIHLNNQLRLIQLTQLQIYNSENNFTSILRSTESAQFIIHYEVFQPVLDPVFQIQIYSTGGVLCYGTHTDRQGLKLGEVNQSGRIILTCNKLNLLEGSYTVQARIWPARFSGDCYSKLESPLPFSVIGSSSQGGGVCYLETEWAEKK